jgi:hypothetical protein
MQTKIRESMSIMGMKLSSYYFSWFVRFFAVYLVLHLICSGIIVSQFPHIPFYVPFLVFILFDIVLILQNFFIQVFVSRAKIGILISLVFFALQYIFSLLSTTSNNPTLGVNTGLSIIPHAAYIMAFRSMIYAESNKITATFGAELNKYVIGYAVASFCFNIILYLVLTWYLDQVVPNEWGAKKHPLFCCFDK